MNTPQRKLRSNWVKACFGKQGHHTMREAETALVLLQAKYPKKPFRAYRCHECNLFHVGGSMNDFSPLTGYSTAGTMPLKSSVDL